MTAPESSTNGENVTDNNDETLPDVDQPIADTEGSDEVEIDLGPDDATGDDGIDLNFGSTEVATTDVASGSDDLAAGLGDDVGLDLDGGINLDFETESDEAEPEESATDTEIAEKAVAELRAELEGKFGDWYVVHTYSGMENRVAQNLENRVTSLNMEDYIFEVRVPTEEVDELRNGQKRRVKRTVLPGYVLVRMDLTDESWSTVRHTPSVTGFVGQSQRPIPLSLDEVEKMLAPAAIAAAQAAVEGGPARGPKAKKKLEVVDFNVGDSVMVVEGPFQGVHATITEINASSQRLKALVEILGRDTPVDLTFTQIQKI